MTSPAHGRNGRLAVRPSAFGLQRCDLPAVQEALVRRFGATAIQCDRTGATFTVRYDPALVAPAQIVGAFVECSVRRPPLQPRPERRDERPSALSPRQNAPRQRVLPRTVVPLSFSVARVVGRVLLQGLAR